MSISFKYRPVRLKSGKVIYKPIIPLVLKSKETLLVLGMLDSGSDTTIIPKEIADQIGIEYTGYNEVSGISGKPIKSLEGKVNIEFGKGHEIYSFNIPILAPINKDVPLIIGRIGFFDHVKILDKTTS